MANRPSFLASSGRDLPHPPSATVLSRILPRVGPQAYHTTRTVSPQRCGLLAMPDGTDATDQRACSYLLSLPSHHLTRLACTPALLRFTNLLLLFALPPIITRLLPSANPHEGKPVISAESVAISLFPPLWFFGHLYYTDVGSCVFVLASWAAAKSGRAWVASLVSCDRNPHCRNRRTDALSWPP
jgi:hypothetical protein